MWVNLPPSEHAIRTRYNQNGPTHSACVFVIVYILNMVHVSYIHHAQKIRLALLLLCTPCGFLDALHRPRS